MPLFYALVGLLFLGLVAGIISLVKNFAGSGDGPENDRTGDPFANRKAVADAAGSAPEVIRGTGGSPPNAADAGQNTANKNTVVSGNPDGGTEAIVGFAVCDQAAPTGFNSWRPDRKEAR
jgi:hypothetical protein